VVLDRGACAGGLSDLVVLEGLLGSSSTREREPGAFEVVTTLPGSALAATSVNTAVSATEPVTSQRLA
jgi:hypothetical protein